MTKAIDIGVIGCGNYGMSVLRKLLKHAPAIRVAALYDPDQRSVDRALAELDPSPVVCNDYREIMKMDNVQWVMIASWNSYHCEQTVAAFQAGKNVFCQKPLAIDFDQCMQMKHAWEKSGKMFNIGFTLRYSPHYRKIKQLISEGNIGEIISLEFNETLDFNHGGYIMGDWRRLRKNAGTHLLEKCCHDIDLVNWLVDADVSRVASFGGLDFFVPENVYHIDRIGKKEDGQLPYTKRWGGLVGRNPFLSDKDIVDNQVAILEYKNGTRATFHTNCNAAIPERRMYILGTEGTIRADVLTGDIALKRIGHNTELENHSTQGKGGHGGGDEMLAAELAASMLKQQPPSVGLIEGLKSAVTCFAIDEAMESGSVIDADNYWRKIT